MHSKKNLLYNFLTVFVSTLFSLYIIEFFLLINAKERFQPDTYNFYVENKEKYKKENNKELVPMLQLLFFEKLKNIPELYSVSPLSNSDTFWCNENGYWPIETTDRYGFFNEDIIWENKIIDYVFIGDSFTAGSCVYKDLNFVSVFSKLDEKKKNLNLGIPGSFPLIEYIKLKEYVEPLIVPKNIVWVYYEGNDLIELEHNLKKYKDTYLLHYLSDNNFIQNLAINNAKKDEDLNKYLAKKIQNIKNVREIRKNQKLKYKYKFSNFLTLTKIRISFKKNNAQDIDENTMQMFYEILKKTKKLSVSLNSRLYFVYLPSIERYYHNFLSKLYYNDKKMNSHFRYNEIVKILDELNIPLIDIKSNVFDKHKDPLSLFPLRIHHHYNELGYKKVGNYIYNNIER